MAGPADKQCKQAIFEAAIREFAEHGYAGARTSRIAQAAEANSALVFYYFQNKEQLYRGVLEQIFATWSRDALQVLASPATPKDQLLAFVGAHHDWLAAAPERPKLVYREFTNRTKEMRIDDLIRRYLLPVHKRLGEVIQLGIKNGSFRELDVQNCIQALIGMTTSYFTNSDVARVVTGKNPFSRNALEQRKAALLDMAKALLLKKVTR